jgi:uncharacterized membrane protein YgcG
MRGRGGPKIVIRRTIKEANATIVYPTLTRTNYEEWTMLMQVNMEAARIWYVVEPLPDEQVEYRDNRLALAAILRSVPSEMLPTLRTKRSARAAWEAMKTICVGVERVRECNAQQLCREFDALTWKDGESVEDFSMHITGLANNLRTLGVDITNATIVHKMLDIVPEHLEQIAVAVEIPRLEHCHEVTGRLRTVEQRRRNKNPTVDNQERLMMTQEEWTAKFKLVGNTKGSSDHGGSGSSGRPGGHGGGRGHGTSCGRGRGTGGGARQGTRPGEGLGPAKKTDKCRYCGKKGH